MFSRHVILVILVTLSWYGEDARTIPAAQVAQGASNTSGLLPCMKGYGLRRGKEEDGVSRVAACCRGTIEDHRVARPLLEAIATLLLLQDKLQQPSGAWEGILFQAQSGLSNMQIWAVNHFQEPR